MNTKVTSRSRKANRKIYIRQKLAGVVLILLGAMSVPVGEDGNAFLLMLFAGLSLIGTREKVLMSRDESEEKR